jgi:hypothetical protein
MLQPTELICILLSYPAPSELGCTMLSYSAPLRTMLHPYELRCTILSYFAHPLGIAVPYWARLHLPELRCTFPSCAAPSWAALHLPELCCTLLSCAANCWTTLQCLSYCTLTKLPPFLQFFRCRIVWHPVSPVSEWKEMQMPEPVRCRNRETQAGTRAFWYWDDRWRNTNADAQLWVPG